MTVYGAFLSRVNEDDWAHCYTAEDMQWFLQDWRAFLENAIGYFKFPQCSLEIDEARQVFTDERMSMQVVQVLATYMKQECLKRTIDSWENIKTQYDEKDFSQANLLKTFIQLKDQVIEEAKLAESIYYRSFQKRPFNYGRLAGRGY